jgi:hypothetical protein
MNKVCPIPLFPPHLLKGLSNIDRQNIFKYDAARTAECLEMARLQRHRSINFTFRKHVPDDERKRHFRDCNAARRCKKIEQVDVFVNRSHHVWTRFVDQGSRDEQIFIGTAQNDYVDVFVAYLCDEFDLWHACPDNAPELCEYNAKGLLDYNERYLCPVSGNLMEQSYVSEFTPGVAGSGNFDQMGANISKVYRGFDEWEAAAASSSRVAEVFEKNLDFDVDAYASKFRSPPGSPTRNADDNDDGGGATHAAKRHASGNGAYPFPRSRRMVTLNSLSSNRAKAIDDRLFEEHQHTMMSTSTTYRNLRFADVSHNELAGWKTLYTRARFIVFAILCSKTRLRYEKQRWTTVNGKIIQESKEMTRNARSEGKLIVFTDHLIMKHRCRVTELSPIYELAIPAIFNERNRERICRYYALCAVELWISATFRTGAQWPNGFIPPREGTIAALYLMRTGIRFKRDHCNTCVVVRRDRFLVHFLPESNIMRQFSEFNLCEAKVTRSGHQMLSAINNGLYDKRCTANDIRLPDIEFAKIVGTGDPSKDEDVEKIFQDALRQQRISSVSE